jgi:polar amino acid transport system substrate-binding protein
MSKAGAILVIWLLVAQALAASAHANPTRDGSSEPLAVAIVESPPFAIKAADGTWSGLSVDAWREVAAKENLRWEVRETDGSHVDALLRDHAVDVALGDIVIDSDSAAVHDFSVPFYANGMGFAEHAAAEASLHSVLATLTSSHLLRLLAMILSGTLLVGVLITLIERRHNLNEFGGPLRQGIATGVWWAAVTMTTVGYGDATPKTATGRSLAFVWMFIGLIAIAIFTASVTSMLTVHSLQGTVRHEADLFHLRLGAIAGGASAEFLRHRHAAFTGFESHEEALAALAEHRVDAVVANTASLRYLISHQWQGTLHVSPIVLEHVTYAFGLPPDSALREPINRALLSIIEQDRWRDVEQHYLGRQ